MLPRRFVWWSGVLAGLLGRERGDLGRMVGVSVEMR